MMVLSAASAGGSPLSAPISFGDVALSLVLVAVAVGVSRWQRVGLERDMTVATLRSFVQLVAVGYILDFIFKGHGALTIAAIAVMVATASLTSAGRAKRVPGSKLIAAAAISVATAGTLGVLAALQIVPVAARAIIPLGSMIITAAMNTTSLVMTRLHDDLAASRREVEARLSLAQSSRQAALPWMRSSIRSGMIPTVDQTKVVGLVALPGAMTGMILAGASPILAIRLQLVVMYMLLGGNAFAALIAAQLTVRRLFTPSHQLIKSLRRTPT
ncbi:MAG: UDP-glucose/iron transport system permease protein [Acidimicrobiaceae bacterium]|jgi:putative ABC transport system permease protein|nr:UDP-glucose/iron transport system permease protein [Acidimicrobiaceae bacterium]